MQATNWTTMTLTAAIAFAGIVAGLGASPAGAAPALKMDGAPLRAEVTFESKFSLPPEAYSLGCGTNLPDCTSGGFVDLATESEVPVAYKGSATKGFGPLSFSLAEGEVTRSFSCGEDGDFVSKLEPVDTEPGELEIASVAADAGANTLAVALNHGGRDGDAFPIETIERSDGGCGSPVQDLTQEMGTWYYHFYNAHRSEQQDVGNDLELTGLTFEDGAFAKEYERFVTVGTPGNSYLAYEETRVEVEPEWCRGTQNRISSAVAGGESMGLDGSSLYPGQVISAPAKARISLADGSAIELEAGDEFRVTACEEDMTEIYLGGTVKKFLAEVKKAVAGHEKKFEVTTERAVAGVRGTVFSIGYDKPKQETELTVTEGSVSLKGINGAKGKVIVDAGEVGVQKGKKAPRLVG